VQNYKLVLVETKIRSPDRQGAIKGEKYEYDI